MKKRRIMALLLAAMICLGQLPITAHAETLTTLDATGMDAAYAQAALDEVNELIHRRETESQKIVGVTGGYLVDVTQDGEPELILMYEYRPEGSSSTYEVTDIYSWNGKKLEGISLQSGGSALRKRDGQFYIDKLDCREGPVYGVPGAEGWARRTIKELSKEKKTVMEVTYCEDRFGEPMNVIRYEADGVERSIAPDSVKELCAQWDSEPGYKLSDYTNLCDAAKVWESQLTHEQESIETLKSTLEAQVNGDTITPEPTQAEAVVPDATVKTAASASEVRLAYRNFIRLMVDQQGILFGELDSMSDENYHGVANVGFADVTGDGSEELIVTWIEGRSDTSEYCGIYTYSNGAVRELYKDHFAADGVYASITAFRQNGMTAVFLWEGRADCPTALRWENGSFLKATEQDFSDSDRERVYEAGYESGLAGESGMYATIVGERVGLDMDAPREEFFHLDGVRGLDGTVEFPAWVDELDIFGADLSGGEAGESGPAQDGSAWKYLNNVPYIGDRSKCKMDGDMARAYAQVLRGLGTLEEYYDYGFPEYQAVLIDFAQTGYPFLLTTIKYDKYRTDDEDGGYGRSTLWGYKDGEAKAYSFEREPGIGDEYPDAYRLLTDILIGTINRGPAVMVSAYEGETEDPIFGYRIYQAQKSDLFLVDSCIGSIGNVDEEIATFLNRYNWKEEQVIGQETNGLGAELHLSVSPISANTVASALEAYAAVAPKALYPNLTELESGGENYDAIVKAALEKVDGEVVGVYKLSDELYVVVVLVGETRQATLVRGAREKGVIVWRTETPGELPTEEELGQMVAQAATRPNVSLDYEKLPSLTDSAALGDYLKEQLDNMEGLTPNDPAKTELGTFLESAIANQSVASVSGKGNRVTVDGAAVAPLVQKAQETRREMEDLLEERDISLNKPIVLILRLVWENADWSKPCQIELDETLAQELQDCSAQLLLGDDRHYLQFTAQQLQALLRDHGALSVQFSQAEEGVYDIRFLDKDGNVVESLSAPVTVGLPAESMTSTVMVSYTGGSDNWGGQYDQNVGTLSFETRFSGRYEVLENDLAVSDIGDLSEESQQAIRFLVSKGFFTLDGDSFRPGDSLTRYEFTQALVGMFFALDRSLTTDFPDVSADSPYYPYVASAQHDGIVNGYSDGTFSGGDPITREQVLALAARTLVDKKGYTLPQDVETYLSGFADRQDISAWAEDQVALAVREGVASRGSVILPKNNITREQAAVVLYRLFLLLYEVRPVALEVPTSTEGGSTAVIVGAVTAAVVGGTGIGGGVWAVLKKRRKR